MGFGKLLEEKMNKKGIKQAELAEAVGIPKTTLSSMILRDNTKIEIEKLLQICEYLDCDPEEFYNEFREQRKKNMPPSFTRKYYALDDFGRDVIDTILEKEYERCKTVKVYRAANSEDNHEDEIVKMSKDVLEKLKNTPMTDEDL